MKVLFTAIAKPLTLILAGLLTACTPVASGDGEPSSQAKTALAEYRAAEKQTYNARDEALFDLFDEDAVIQACGAQALHGRSELRDFFLNDYWKNNTAKILEVNDYNIVESGEYLITNGDFIVEVTPNDTGETRRDSGRFLAVFKMGADGKYRLWREAGLDAASPSKD